MHKFKTWKAIFVYVEVKSGYERSYVPYVQTTRFHIS